MHLSPLDLLLLVLSTQAKCLHDSTVAVDVAVLQISEQRTTLTDELGQRTCGVVVLVVLLQVLCQMSNAIAEESNLALSRTRVGCRLSVLLENLSFLFFV